MAIDGLLIRRSQVRALVGEPNPHWLTAIALADFGSIFLGLLSPSFAVTALSLVSDPSTKSPSSAHG